MTTFDLALGIYSKEKDSDTRIFSMALWKTGNVLHDQKEYQ